MQNTMNLPDGIASLKEKLESAFTFENGADNLGNFKIECKILSNF